MGHHPSPSSSIEKTIFPTVLRLFSCSNPFCRFSALKGRFIAMIGFTECSSINAARRRRRKHVFALFEIKIKRGYQPEKTTRPKNSWPDRCKKTVSHTQHNTHQTLHNPSAGARRSQFQNSLPKRDKQFSIASVRKFINDIYDCDIDRSPTQLLEVCGGGLHEHKVLVGWEPYREQA